ncbi:hypothetical protein [Amycolatopsis kentuckyensis]
MGVEGPRPEVHNIRRDPRGNQGSPTAVIVRVTADRVTGVGPSG